MREQLQELLELDTVIGAIFLSPQGEKLFEEYNSHSARRLSSRYQWADFINVLEDITEADFLFRNRRIFVRQSDAGYLLVIMTPSPSSLAMVRLLSDTILSAMKSGHAISRKGKGLFKRFLK